MLAHYVTACMFINERTFENVCLRTFQLQLSLLDKSATILKFLEVRRVVLNFYYGITIKKFKHVYKTRLFSSICRS